MFAPDAPIRQVNAEGVLILGGGRALLMQVAHPLVARGVAEHSDYRRGRIGRLVRTLRPMYAIAFGTEDEAQRAASSVRGMHAYVRGEGYRAEDADLLAWVLATLIDSALLMHRRFVGPLSPALVEGYYRDTLALGELLGTPRDALPPSVAGFEAYVRDTVASLEVTEEARQIARDLFAPLPESPWLSPAMPLVRGLTAGLLPPRLREAYGLSWGPGREALLDVVASLSRLVLPSVPRPLRTPPALLMPPSWSAPREGGRG